MKKSQVIRVVQKELQISDKEYKEALDVMLSKISTALIKGEKVTLYKFGTFTTTYHKARKGVNPQTGEPLAIPKKRVVKFKPCKALKEKVNNYK